MKNDLQINGDFYSVPAMRLQYAKILINGRAGFIGSHLADALLEMNNDVINCDSSSPYHLRKRCRSRTVVAGEITGYAEQVFNLRSGHRISVDDLLWCLFRLCEKEDAIEPIYEMVALGDVKSTYADIRKARSIFGCEPRTSLKEGLRNFVQWHGACKNSFE